MCFNKRLTLLTLKYPVGRGEPEVTERAEVWADVSDVGTVTRLQAMSAGINAELTAVMRRAEYHGYTHAEYGGVRYRIAAAGAAANKLHIKLTMERG